LGQIRQQIVVSLSVLYRQAMADFLQTGFISCQKANLRPKLSQFFRYGLSYALTGAANQGIFSG
jgi:hypothetical protein